jgi:hypothetical protein
MISRRFTDHSIVARHNLFAARISDHFIAAAALALFPQIGNRIITGRKTQKPS